MNEQPGQITLLVPSLGGGGAERVSVHLANEFSRQGKDVLIVTFEDTGAYRQQLREDIRVIALGKTHRWHFASMLVRTARILKSEQRRDVLGILYYANIILIAAMLLFRLPCRPVVCEHSLPDYYLKRDRFGILKRLLISFTYKRAFKTVAVSRNIREMLINRYGCSPERTQTIHNPVPIHQIRKSMKVPVAHPFFAQKASKVIISCGRLVPVKRFDRLMMAFEKVRKNGEDCYLLIIGEGRCKEELQALRHSLASRERIDLAGYQSNPYAWMAQADLYVSSSDFEGLPMTLLEAMVCQTPVVATNCPYGPEEIITHGENGLLTACDEQPLADGIATALRDEELCRTMVRNASKYVQRFDAAEIAAAYVKLFQEPGTGES